MDEKPFFTLNLNDIRDSSIKILGNFTKTDYNLESILDSAEALKYIKAIRKEFEKEVIDPSDEFVKMLVNKFFDKPLTASRMVTFREYTKKAVNNSINDSISLRLKSALNINESITKDKTPEIENPIDSDVEVPKFITTEEELEGFQIVKAILREKIATERIAFRDTQSYFGILLDDNNRKPLARLHFNSSNKYIEVFHHGKDLGEKILLNSLDDIYNYREQLHKTFENY
ncbi:hypothetical protein [Kaistella sp. SH40-3]|uniref:hypothetical protein n=1 Tax=unclassified Kaistella TaxID=2762626 RepID=UPI00351F5A1D